MSSWWAAIHGYRHPVLDAAVTDQLSRMSHVMFGGLTHEGAVRLAQRLTQISPPGLDNVFLADSGSVSVEIAIKMCLQYWRARGRPAKSRLLTVRGGYHGDTFGAMAVCDPETGMHHLFSDVLARHVFAERPPAGYDAPLDPAYVASLEQLVAEHADRLAAVVVEPVVQGAGGMRFYAPGYLNVLRELCDRHEVLLLVDEIATGFGRSGTLFGCGHAGVSPDVMCVGKALTGGYLTMAAALCTAEVAAGISSGAGPLMHGPTFMGNPLAAAVANASIDLLLAGDWAGRVRRIEALLTAGLGRGEAARPRRGRPGARCDRRRPTGSRRGRPGGDRDRAGAGRVAAPVPRPDLHDAALRLLGRGRADDRRCGRRGRRRPVRLTRSSWSRSQWRA